MKATERIGIVDFIVYTGHKQEVINFCAQFKEDWETRFYYDKEFLVVFVALPDGDQSLTRGDILVRNSLGEYFPIDPVTFKKLYVPYLENNKKIDN